MPNTKVRDAGDSRRYFTQLPNIIDDADLSVYAFRLYVHLKRVAGEDGKCIQSERTLAKACHMSAGSINNAKKVLEKAELIQIEIITNEHGEFDSDEITIMDIWRENMNHYSACSLHEQELLTTRAGPHHHMSRTCSCGELKNNSTLNNKDNNKELLTTEPVAPDPTPKISVREKKPTEPPDPRKDHPAIVAIREVTNRFPPKPAWDLIIHELGEVPRVDHLREIFSIWVATGFSPVNYVGILAWYRDGIPVRFSGPKSKSQQREDNNRLIIQESLERAEALEHDNSG